MGKKNSSKKSGAVTKKRVAVVGARKSGAGALDLALLIELSARTEDPWEVCKEPKQANILVLDGSVDPSLINAENSDFVILNLTEPPRKTELDTLADKPDRLDLILQRWSKKLIVVVSADLLRGDAVRLTRGLDWETTIEDLAFEFAGNPILARLKTAAHVLVTFGADAVYWRSAEPRGRAVAGLHAGADATIVFDANTAEGEWKAENKVQTVRGAGECVIVSAVRALEGGGCDELHTPLRQALAAIRQANIGGLDVTEAKLADALRAPQKLESFVSVTVPAAPGGFPERGRWSMLDQWNYHAGRSSHPRPHYEIAQGLAFAGPLALAQFPVAVFGALSTVDRHEIESLRTIRQLIQGYVANDKAKKPLCLGVFGPPGAGKSFGVNEIAKAVLGIEKEDILTFNLSEYADSSAIVDALGTISKQRDELEQRNLPPVPFVFWDEFDSGDYRWLQYLLAPMQDGAYRDAEGLKKVGRCVFVFAGATSPTFQDFGPVNPLDTGEELDPADRIRAEQKWREFVLRKGPDFKSRLAGFLNVLGPNPRQIVQVVRGAKRLVDDPSDVYWPIRRALFIRGQFRLKPEEELAIDLGVLRAMLEVPRYRAGSRSLEFLCDRLKTKSLPETGLRTSLPGDELMGIHVDAAKFWELVERDREFELDSARLAPGLHAAYHGNPGIDLSDDGVQALWNAVSDAEDRASNFAQAAGIPSILRVAGYRCVPGDSGPASDWNLLEEMEAQRALFAEAEHNRWMVDRLLRGWKFGEPKDKSRKIHSDLKPFTHLGVEEKLKDEWLILGRPAAGDSKAIPNVLARLRRIGWRVERGG